MVHAEGDVQKTLLRPEIRGCVNTPAKSLASELVFSYVCVLHALHVGFWGKLSATGLALIPGSFLRACF